MRTTAHVIVACMRWVPPRLLALATILGTGCIYVENDEFVDDDEGSGEGTTASGCIEAGRSPYVYYLCTSDPQPWAAAEAACNGLGAGVELASIVDEVENGFVADRLGQPAWIGGRIVDGNWTWSDGSTFEFVAWGPDANNDPELDSIEMAANGSWSNVNGGVRLAYICKGPEA